MGIVLLLVILALVLGGIGMLVEGLFWLLVIGAVLLVAGAVMGFMKSRDGRGSAVG